LLPRLPALLCFIAMLLSPSAFFATLRLLCLLRSKAEYTGGVAKQKRRPAELHACFVLLPCAARLAQQRSKTPCILLRKKQASKSFYPCCAKELHI
jgi:hypothetical protein